MSKVKVIEVDEDLARRDLKGRSWWKELNHINTSGKYTQNLLEILPQDTVSTILRIYRLTKDLKEKTPRYSYLPRKDALPSKDLEKIRSVLEKFSIRAEHKKDNDFWLFDDDVKEIMKFIYEKFQRSAKGRVFLRAKAIEHRIQALKITKTTDEPINIAIYLLAANLKQKSIKSKWKLILEFLIEQGIILAEATFVEDNIRDRYRCGARKIREQYNFFRELYLYPDIQFTRSHHFLLDEKRNRSSYYYREVLLPNWLKIVPK